MKWLNNIETDIYRVSYNHPTGDNWVVSDWEMDATFFKTKEDAISFVRKHKKELQKEYKEYVEKVGKPNQNIIEFYSKLKPKGGNNER